MGGKGGGKEEEEKNASGECAVERIAGDSTLYETDITMNPREREFPLTR